MHRASNRAGAGAACEYRPLGVCTMARMPRLVWQRPAHAGGICAAMKGSWNNSRGAAEQTGGRECCQKLASSTPQACGARRPRPAGPPLQLGRSRRTRRAPHLTTGAQLRGAAGRGSEFCGGARAGLRAGSFAAGSWSLRGLLGGCRSVSRVGTRERGAKSALLGRAVDFGGDTLATYWACWPQNCFRGSL